MFTFTVLAFCACLLFWVLQKLADKARSLPPGPFRFPLIGCLPQILMLDSTLPYIAFAKLGKIYNSNIIYIQLGVVKAVVLNGYEANKEILSSDDWLGRNQEKWQIGRQFFKKIGLIHADVDHWRESRRFCVKTLRDFGFGIKKKMDIHIAEQCEEFCNDLRKSIGGDSGVVQIKHLFDLPILNSTWTLITGRPFERDDPNLPGLFAILDEFFKSCSLGAGLLTAYPFLVDVAPKLVKFDKQMEAHIKFQNYFKDLIAQVRAAGAHKEHATTFMEVFVQKIDETQKVDPGNPIFSDENLIAILYDLFLGSTETTSNTISRSIAYLLRYPDVQAKVTKEIDAVVGRARFATMADKENMPYTCATILELLRVTCVVPIGPRKLHKDATFGPYKIQKGTTVFPNFWSICNDEKVWSQPDEFRPERFLDANGKVINEDRIMPFAIGKRNCIGESIARAIIFILLTGLLQQFEFHVNPKKPEPPLEPELGITLMPKPFSFVVKVRH